MPVRRDKRIGGGSLTNGASAVRYSLRYSPLASLSSRCNDPDWVLAELGTRLQTTVGDLETLMFEAPGVGPRSRTEINDAVALVMEALQVLCSAREGLERTPAHRVPSAAELLNGPLVRA